MTGGEGGGGGKERKERTAACRNPVVPNQVSLPAFPFSWKAKYPERDPERMKSLNGV